MLSGLRSNRYTPPVQNLAGAAHQSASGSVRLAGLGVLAGVFDDHAGALLRDLLAADGGEGLWCDQHAERIAEFATLGARRTGPALDPASSARAPHRSRRHGDDRALWRGLLPDLDDAGGKLDALCSIRRRHALYLADVSVLLVSAVADLQGRPRRSRHGGHYDARQPRWFWRPTAC